MLCGALARWRVAHAIKVHDTLDQVKDFSERVRSGELRGATGKNLTNIVAVGIGGSYLGPEFVHEVSFFRVPLLLLTKYGALRIFLFWTT